jgi:hypothetical protein
VRQISSTVQVSHHAKRQVAVAEHEQDTLMRGLVHGVILSTVVWTAALYVILILG